MSRPFYEGRGRDSRTPARDPQSEQVLSEIPWEYKYWPDQLHAPNHALRPALGKYSWAKFDSAFSTSTIFALVRIASRLEIADLRVDRRNA